MKKQESLINIVTCSYNHQKYIGQCIEGVLMQKTNFKYLHVIGDDASTDNTSKIIKEYERKYPEKIKLVSHPKNVGAQKNTQVLFKQVNAKYIALCDGDDYWTDPYKLQKQVDFLEANEDYGICLHKVTEENTLEKQKKQKNIPKINQNTIYTIEDYILSNRTATCSIVFKRNNFFPIPSFYEKTPFGDLALILTVMSRTNRKAMVLNDNMGVYRIHREGIHGNFHTSNKTLIKAYSQHLEFTKILIKVPFFKENYFNICMEKLDITSKKINQLEQSIHDEQKKILFISHDASRTGAPILLLNLIKWLKKNTNWNFDILLLAKGELENEFKELGQVYFWQAPKQTPIGLKKQIYNRIFKVKSNSVDKHFEQLFLDLKNNNYDLIYANTVLTINVAIKIKNEYNNPIFIINDIHEFPAIIDNALQNFDKLANYSDIIIASSYLHKQILIENYGVKRNKIYVIPDFTSKDIKKATNKKKETFIVGTMGTVHWRKGDDVFLQVARLIAEKYHNKIKFIWIGHITRAKEIIIKNDIKKLGLTEIVEFKQASIDYRKYYDKIDVFVLLSREDPFPLVAIEAGMKGRPVICFEKASGISEIVRQSKGGFVVKYLSIEKVAEKIAYYFANRNKLKEDGNKNIEFFREFTVDKIAPQIYDLLLKTLK